MDIVLNGNDIEVRAYLASQIGPLRRPYGTTRTVRASTAPSRVSINTTSDRALYVAVELITAGSTQTAFANNSAPMLNRDLTITMISTTTIQDFVLLPGEELWMVAAAVRVYSSFEVTF